MQYASTTRFDTNDVLIKDGTNGTKIIKAKDAAIEFAGLVSTTNHKNVFRGKNLGTAITDAQLDAIDNGTFDDLYIGDYWTLNGRRYDIADLDYWYHTGDQSFNTHHLTMIAHTRMSETRMNATNTTEGGYVGSELYANGLDGAINTLRTDFGNKLLKHREYLVNGVTDGKPSSAIWKDSYAELMNEIMLYGCRILSSGEGVDADSTVDCKQLAIFRLEAKTGVDIYAAWLRDVASDKAFCTFSVQGYAYLYNASHPTRGVLPVFAIGKNQ